MTGRRSLIESLSNPLVKRMRLLREKRHRRAEGLFLAEGLRIATEAREAGVLPQWLFLGPEGDAHPLAAVLVADTLAAGGEVIDTTGAILSKLSGKDNPQTVVGIYAEPQTTLADLDRDAAPTFILTGNESQGMPSEYADAADVRVKMPMMGKADSLNAAVATAVMAYEVLNQRRG